MKSKSFVICLALALFCFGRPAAAQDLRLTAASDSYALSAPLQYYRDASAALGFEEIRALPAARWRRSQHGRPNFYIGRDIIWLSFTVANESDRERWVLFSDYYLLDFVDVYLVRRTSPATGAPDAAHVTAFHQRLKAIELELPPGESVRVYVRVQSRITRLINLKIRSPAEFEQYSDMELGFHISYFTLIAFMVLVNLCLFLFTRSTTPLFYLVFLLIFAFYQASLSGFTRELFYPDRPELNLPILHICGGLVGISVALFCKNLALLRIHAPRCNRILDATIVGIALFMLYSVSPFRAAWIEYIFNRILILIQGTTVLIAMFIALRQDFRPATFSILGLLIVYTSAIGFFLMLDGVLPANGWLNFSMPIGNIIDSILFFMALGSRMNFLLEQAGEGGQALSEKERTEIYRQRHENQRNAAQRYSIPRLSGVDIPELKARLRHVMEQDELFRDDLTLSGLAQILEITEKDLSELLNAHLGLSFYGLLHHYRVQEACRLLLEQPEQTVLAIGYEAGFKNLSTFNSAFVKETGMSPGRYRKTHGEKKRQTGQAR